MERLRVDKWLWFSRLVKSRTIAAGLVDAGQVRINKVKARKASQEIGAGDVLTVATSGRVLVVRIVACGARRGPAPEARTLYEMIEAPDE